MGSRFKPWWLALVMVYWSLESPQYAGLGRLFLIGLLADVLFGTLLGEQALRLCILGFLLLRFRARLRFFRCGSNHWRCSPCC